MNKKELINIVSEKRDLTKGIITPKSGFSGNLGNNPTSKPKSQWNLEDYRLHAPQELESNPTLYTRLVNETYNN